jgi:uncharacterized protein
MPVEMIRDIVDEAARHGLPVFAHISSVPELEAAVDGGAGVLAHAVGDEPEPGPEHVRMLVESDVAVTPTLAWFYALHRYQDDPTLLDDPFLRAGVAEEAIESARQAPIHRIEGIPDFMRQRLLGAVRHVGEARRAGVTIALGTDAAGNTLNFPGFSAHVEMQLLAEAGLTPMEVIEAATRRGAELLRRADEFGTVEPGKRADLLILGANPLVDIRNTRSLETVISEGRVVDRQALALPAPVPARAQQPLPVIDMHLHASAADAYGPPPLAVCVSPAELPLRYPTAPWGTTFMEWQKDPPCSEPVWSPTTDRALLEETVAALERRNVIGVLSGTPERVREWTEAAPSRFIPGFQFQFGRETTTPEGLGALYRAGRFVVLAEVTNQYVGIGPSDTRFEPYLAVAEELDIPVGIHIGTGPPGAPYLGFGRYRAASHSPLTLEDALVRHPDLRVYIAHAGWPMLDDLLALLWTHPQVHVDIGGIVFALPRPELYRYLRTVVEAGFGKRVMFGSDQMVWPGVIEPAIAIIEEAPFLSEEQKRDILYNNAARFLRLSDEEIARHHGW